MERLSQMGPKGNHMYPYKMEREGDWAHTEKEKGLNKLTLKIGWMQPQAKECQQPREAGRGKEHILS